MSHVIAIDDNGTRREYRVPTFAEFTIADWHRLCLPENTEEGQAQLMEEVKRMTGVPMRLLRKMPAKEFDKLTDAYVKLRTEADARKAEVEAESFTNPGKIEHGGITYIVPKDIDDSITAGQYADLLAAVEKNTTDPELYATLCGTLLIPEGKEYDGPFTDAMQTLPVRIAMGLSAFFFERSQRCRTALAHYFRCRVTSLLPVQEPEAAPSTPATPRLSTS